MATIHEMLVSGWALVEPLLFFFGYGSSHSNLSRFRSHCFFGSAAQTLPLTNHTFHGCVLPRFPMISSVVMEFSPSTLITITSAVLPYCWMSLLMPAFLLCMHHCVDAFRSRSRKFALLRQLQVQAEQRKHRAELAELSQSTELLPAVPLNSNQPPAPSELDSSRNPSLTHDNKSSSVKSAQDMQKGWSAAALVAMRGEKTQGSSSKCGKRMSLGLNALMSVTICASLAYLVFIVASEAEEEW
mmetsp:Transcript_16760/g.32658  ORF Transcript_16760/g.32658 Transcript_16760/m.32658 type:complete len:243 (+) Transcript_16760:2809-3537(+)